MTDFYLTLPSDACTDIYPENTPGHYYTQLPQEIDLSGKDFEIGLAEIQFPTSYTSIDEPMHLIYKSATNTDVELVTLPVGLYDSQETLISKLNALMSETIPGGSKAKTKFFYDAIAKRTVLKINKDEGLEISPPLAALLHFPKLSGKMIWGAVRKISEADIDFSQSETIYIYCDLVFPRQVGASLVPLLRTIPTIDKTVHDIHKIYDRIHYLQMSRSRFSVVEILLSSDKGKVPHFGKGRRSEITLHVRPRKHS